MLESKTDTISAMYSSLSDPYGVAPSSGVRGACLITLGINLTLLVHSAATVL